MYVPAHFAADDGLVSELLTRHGAADLVTNTSQGLLATMLPFIHDPAAGEHGALLGHLARNNDQWKVPAIGESLVIVRGADAYISPSWYQSTAEHGRVVPTWNYITAHVYGRLVIHDDPGWVEDLVRRLTDKHEGDRAQPWCGGRRAAGVHRGSAARDRRRGAGHHADRGEGQAEPEPAAGRHRRRDRGPARRGPATRTRPTSNARGPRRSNGTDRSAGSAAGAAGVASRVDAGTARNLVAR